MIQHIKDNPLWRSIPIVMLTAKTQQKDKLHALTVGVDDYLTKPFNIEKLQVRIANLLANSEQRKAWVKEQLKGDNQVISPSESDAILVRKVDLEWLKEVEEEISEQLDNESYNVTELAKKMNVSDRHLSRRLKKINGLTPAKFIKEIRLKTAREYLEEGVYLTVTEVAYAVGFETPGSFSKSYKARFGKPPSASLIK
jgi:transcriptional regulator GlxA family with amidase domain